MNAEQQRFYSKGYSAGKKDKPERVKKLERQVKELRREMVSLTSQNVALMNDMNRVTGYTEREVKMFSYFWQNAYEGTHIKFLAINFPELVEHAAKVESAKVEQS